MRVIINRLPVIMLAVFLLSSCEKENQGYKEADFVHAVTDLSHEFTFYSDHRFHKQYLPDQKGVTNWCNLYNFNFDNANLLILPGCDNRIGYFKEDLEAIRKFLNSGGGVLMFGSENSKSQNKLINEFGASFNKPAEYPLIYKNLPAMQVEGENADAITFTNPENWETLIADSNNEAVMARKRIGKGCLMVSARPLAGSHPSARDSINKDIWRPLLKEISSGKVIDRNSDFKGAGIDMLEYNDNHGTFKLSYNDYLKPFADAMVNIYKKSLPFIEARMGVPLSPGMASQITLLATGGGGFSSGTVVALAVWWGGFPEKEDSMIEFLTHESVHSWVLPYPEVWNEPIATYVGNLVMMDMGHREEAELRIARTIERATNIDPDMINYDLSGKLTGQGSELSAAGKNNIHWGKTYWILEELRKEKPDFLADYFRLKRSYCKVNALSRYDINNTVAMLSITMGRDLFGWFNQIGIPAEKAESEIEINL